MLISPAFRKIILTLTTFLVLLGSVLVLISSAVHSTNDSSSANYNLTTVLNNNLETDSVTNFYYHNKQIYYYSTTLKQWCTKSSLDSKSTPIGINGNLINDKKHLIHYQNKPWIFVNKNILSVTQESTRLVFNNSNVYIPYQVTASAQFYPANYDFNHFNAYVSYHSLLLWVNANNKTWYQNLSLTNSDNMVYKNDGAFDYGYFDKSFSSTFLSNIGIASNNKINITTQFTGSTKNLTINTFDNSQNVGNDISDQYLLIYNQSFIYYNLVSQEWINSKTNTVITKSNTLSDQYLDLVDVDGTLFYLVYLKTGSWCLVNKATQSITTITKSDKFYKPQILNISNTVYLLIGVWSNNICQWQAFKINVTSNKPTINKTADLTPTDTTSKNIALISTQINPSKLSDYRIIYSESFNNNQTLFMAEPATSNINSASLNIINCALNSKIYLTTNNQLLFLNSQNSLEVKPIIDSTIFKNISVTLNSIVEKDDLILNHTNHPITLNFEVNTALTYNDQFYLTYSYDKVNWLNTSPVMAVKGSHSLSFKIEKPNQNGIVYFGLKFAVQHNLWSQSLQIINNTQKQILPISGNIYSLKYNYWTRGLAILPLLKSDNPSVKIQENPTTLLNKHILPGIYASGTLQVSLSALKNTVSLLYIIINKKRYTISNLRSDIVLNKDEITQYQITTVDVYNNQISETVYYPGSFQYTNNNPKTSYIPNSSVNSQQINGVIYTQLGQNVIKFNLASKTNNYLKSLVFSTAITKNKTTLISPNQINTWNDIDPSQIKNGYFEYHNIKKSSCGIILLKATDLFDKISYYYLQLNTSFTMQLYQNLELLSWDDQIDSQGQTSIFSQLIHNSKNTLGFSASQLNIKLNTNHIYNLKTNWIDSETGQLNVLQIKNDLNTLITSKAKTKLNALITSYISSVIKKYNHPIAYWYQILNFDSTKSLPKTYTAWLNYKNEQSFAKWFNTSINNYIHHRDDSHNQTTLILIIVFSIIGTLSISIIGLYLYLHYSKHSNRFYRKKRKYIKFVS